MRWLLAEWQRLRPYFSLFDFAAPPSTRVGWLVRVGIYALVSITLYRRVVAVTAPLLGAKPPTFIPTEGIEDYRFLLPERTRREIFAELAQAEIAERKRAVEQNTWRGHAWSREDDRGHAERVKARLLAAKYKVSLTQVYLILDEGIRARWPGPDGNPIVGTTPKLDQRWNQW